MRRLGIRRPPRPRSATTAGRTDDDTGIGRSGITPARFRAQLR
jgi:hypothetical protein